MIFQLSFSSRGSFPPLAASLGGIVGQEVLKALTGKYTPLRQWVRRKLGRNEKVSCRVLFSRNSLSAEKKAISTQIWRRVQNSNLQQIKEFKHRRQRQRRLERHKFTLFNTITFARAFFVYFCSIMSRSLPINDINGPVLQLNYDCSCMDNLSS